MEEKYSMEELLPIAAKLAHKYTEGESTSLSWERAQMLMEAISYCIRECGYRQEDALQETFPSAQTAWELGCRIVTEKVQRLRMVYNRLILSFDDYGMICLGDVIKKGIPEFLKWYDVRFCPQDTILLLDYPVLADMNSLTGVDAVLPYVECIAREQEFLAGFEKSYVLEVLQAWHTDYVELTENLCAVVLPNLIAHLLLQKPLAQQGFSKEELEQLRRVFAARRETEALLKKAIAAIVRQSCGENTDLENYLGCGIRNMAVRIQQAAELQTLERIFCC